MNEKVRDFVIIGGGLQGCSIAFFLARAGRRVTIVEKSIPGRHASGVNAGGLRLLLRDAREYPLSLRAMEMWENLDQFVGGPAAAAAEVCLGTSQIALAVDREEMQWAESRSKDMIRRGIVTEELVDAAELHRLLPGLTNSALGGLISRRDGHANPASAASAFRLAAEGAGVEIWEGCNMRGMSPTSSGWRTETDRGAIESDVVVNCAGAWGSKIAASVDEELPVNVMALSMMVTTRVAPFVKPVVIGIDRPLSFKQSAVGSLVIGGGISGKPCLDDDTSFIVMDRMASSAAATVAAFPALANISVVRSWTGLEGLTPDGVPYISPSARHPGLWHVFGFCGHGFQLSPAVGETVARSLTTGSLDPRLAPFAADRFAKDTTRAKEALR
ncbi:FAD-binding oxidoreductase (plasmid) [Agrobacterium fabrum]|uniref:NAD(P)/FAD-dependent oxidoreductase n=1 Tax=Rhizobium/Agrobacterium group TaxID=227290 RepID=UPI0004DA6069|nr:MULTISPECIES: FAD-binding oxidoreductase [Rhizobium/Agrobacterium group]KEA04432.1 sarcosine oxidase subunit beta [Rhizobium rhizogenes]NMV72551.1 FAD-binding oxidoreductase [Agrobacterium fabrum]NTI85384.1 FAD-binding oxidoreductase [Rhizobium rhizogenes]NTJ27567.1 FAD-binding oxidoreductase [Rhizobium rhizogenes]QRM41755.1 FAD-binding oxidoreductase [Rhizobium rhizogenes]